MMVGFMWIGISSILTGLLGIVLYLQHQRLVVLRDLCELRQSSADLYRAQYQTQLQAQSKLIAEAEALYRSSKTILGDYTRLERKNAVLRAHSAPAELTRLQKVNEDLTLECAKLVQHNHTLEHQMKSLEAENAAIEQIQVQKFELRQRTISLELENRKLQERNEELEYAINLESISMLESYQARDKLFSTIDDVRRSLTRILNPA
jgi:hypothetical protein